MRICKSCCNRYGIYYQHLEKLRKENYYCIHQEQSFKPFERTLPGKTHPKFGLNLG